MRRPVLFLACALPIGLSSAADVTPPPDLIPVEAPEGDAAATPAPPPSAEEEGELQPEVVIRKKGKNTIEEYRIHGRLYKVKVTPPVGPPYFLLDSDGDGYMDVRRNDLKDQMVVPQWVLFSW